MYVTFGMIIIKSQSCCPLYCATSDYLDRYTQLIITSMDGCGDEASGQIPNLRAGELDHVILVVIAFIFFDKWH